MTGSNVLATLNTSTATVVIPPGSSSSGSVQEGKRNPAAPLLLDAARPPSAAPKDSDQSATTGRGPASIVKISKAAARANAVADRLGPAPGPANQLSDQERQVVAKLKTTDREVRAHEQAHATAGGQHAGAPSYEYQRGPDGRQYAVGGEVPIDTSPVPGDPEATIDKMEVVKRAALAPAEPSGQDRSVAAQADAKKRQAQAELTEQKAEERVAATEGEMPTAGQTPSGPTIAVATITGGGLIGPAVNGAGSAVVDIGATIQLVA